LILELNMKRAACGLNFDNDLLIIEPFFLKNMGDIGTKDETGSIPAEVEVSRVAGPKESWQGSINQSNIQTVTEGGVLDLAEAGSVCRALVLFKRIESCYL
jgi:hypothetical protein